MRVNATTCVCGCDRAITAGSASPDWYNEVCFQNWRRRQVGLPEIEVRDPDADPWADVFTSGDKPDLVTAVRTPSGRLYRFEQPANRGAVVDN